MSLKRDHICPQCEHRKRWQIEHIGVWPNQPLPVAHERRFAGAFRGEGRFEALICAQCGFTELYAQGLEELKPDPSMGVYFIDDEPKAGLR
jgi:hypothetical protein